MTGQLDISWANVNPQLVKHQDIWGLYHLYIPSMVRHLTARSSNLKATRLGVKIIVLHWNLIGPSATQLQRCLTNSEHSHKSKPTSLWSQWSRSFEVSGDLMIKMSYCLVNRSQAAYPDMQVHSATFNSLTPGRFEWNFWPVIFELFVVIDGWGIPC